MRRWGGSFRGRRRGHGRLWTQEKVWGGAEGEKSLGGVVETEDCVLWVLVGG